MADIDDRPNITEEHDLAASAVDDPRKPYEAPRLLKKRSVARATLFTAVGASMMTLTAMG
ncbi:Hypothetical protein A7982_10772 [Minicystis rosea]|nr:Hypothetical protein A7982_10772 [Minicystis rosea]